MSVQESDAALCRGVMSGERPGRKCILERVSQHSSQYYRKNTCRVDAGPPVWNSATARREEAAPGETSSSDQVLKWRSCLHSQLWPNSKSKMDSGSSYIFGGHTYVQRLVC